MKKVFGNACYEINPLIEQQFQNKTKEKITLLKKQKSFFILPS